MNFNRRTLSILVIAGVASLALGRGAESRHYAVVVGSLMPDDSLSFTINDAKLMSDVLKANGAEVRLLLPSTSPQPNRVPILEACKEMAAKAGPDDVFWFYFSGHGTLGRDGRSYLVPRDVRPMDIGSLIAASDVRKIVSQHSKARVNLFVLDACNSGSMKSASVNTTSPFEGVRGSVTIAACRPDQTALEIPLLRHGLFTFFLVRGLAGEAAGGDGRVSLQSLRNYVVSQVESFSSKSNGVHRQDPQSPVFEFSPSLQGQPVATAQPEVLAALPTPAGPVQPMRPFKPGLILSVSSSGSGEGANQATQLLQSRLLAAKIPVLDARRAGEFESVLSSGSIAAAAAQAGDLTATFLLRLRLEVTAHETNFNGTRVWQAEVVVRGELVDSDGRVLASDTSDSVFGIPVAASAFSRDRAVSQAIAKAIEALASRAMPAMERHVAGGKRP